MNPLRPPSSPSIDRRPLEVMSAIKAGTVAIDVREPAEFAAAAIPGAINVSLGRIQQHGIDALRQAGIDVDADIPLVMVCRSGARSGVACQQLSGPLGGRTSNLAGGVIAWQMAGLPLAPGGLGRI